jgi:hypothetical protein
MMKDTGLDKLVREYLVERDKGPALDVFLRFFGRLNLKEAIERAGYRIDGKVHDHQRLVGKVRLDRASQALTRKIDEIKACKSFEQLHASIEDHTKKIVSFGLLARYDISLRIGASLDLWPECVYLHAGTTNGCKAIGLKISSKRVERSELPKPIRALEPHHAENFLCIFKDRLIGLGRKAKGC